MFQYSCCCLFFPCLLAHLGVGALVIAWKLSSKSCCCSWTSRGWKSDSFPVIGLQHLLFLFVGYPKGVPSFFLVLCDFALSSTMPGLTHNFCVTRLHIQISLIAYPDLTGSRKACKSGLRLGTGWHKTSMIQASRRTLEPRPISGFLTCTHSLHVLQILKLGGGSDLESGVCLLGLQSYSSIWDMTNL